MKVMTVRDLIVALQDIDPDAIVDAEGCDCINPVTGVDTYEHRADRVLIAITTDDDTPW